MKQDTFVNIFMAGVKAGLRIANNKEYSADEIIEQAGYSYLADLCEKAKNKYVPEEEQE